MTGLVLSKHFMTSSLPPKRQPSCSLVFWSDRKSLSKASSDERFLMSSKNLGCSHRAFQSVMRARRAEPHARQMAQAIDRGLTSSGAFGLGMQQTRTGPGFGCPTTVPHDRIVQVSECVVPTKGRSARYLASHPSVPPAVFGLALRMPRHHHQGLVVQLYRVDRVVVEVA